MNGEQAGGWAAQAGGWAAQALATVRTDPAAIEHLFPLVRRRCGRASVAQAAGDPVAADEAVRGDLLAALPVHGAALAEVLGGLYGRGDPVERESVLRALTRLGPRLGPAALPIVEDALRANDPRLVAAALGRYAERHLSPPAYRQAVLKCVFMGIPLSQVAVPDERCDAELARMLSDFAAEREAAGRTVPADIWPIIGRSDARCASSTHTST
jgi:hypothetical protein